MVALTVGEKQVVLLSKGHYPLNSLHVLIAKACKLPTCQVSQDSMYRYVVKLYCKLYDAGLIRTQYRELLSHWFESGSMTRGQVTKDLLSHIAICVVDGMNIEIDEEYKKAVEEENVAVASIG